MFKIASEMKHLVLLIALLLIYPLLAIPLSPEDLANGHTMKIDPNNPEDARRMLEQHNVNITELLRNRAIQKQAAVVPQHPQSSANPFYPPPIWENHTGASSQDILQSRKE